MFVLRLKVASTSCVPSLLPPGPIPLGPAMTRGLLRPRAVISLATHCAARVSFLSGFSGVKTTTADLPFVTNGNIPPCRESCCGGGISLRAAALSSASGAAFARRRIRKSRPRPAGPAAGISSRPVRKQSAHVRRDRQEEPSFHFSTSFSAGIEGSVLRFIRWAWRCSRRSPRLRRWMRTCSCAAAADHRVWPRGPS